MPYGRVLVVTKIRPHVTPLSAAAEGARRQQRTSVLGPALSLS
ncbi:MAG TPA: hypothetical protein VK028_12640 [Micromonosporaceae bacterium]|nr:hypothetical protein [Micromonosporaceae bacterium]